MKVDERRYVKIACIMVNFLSGWKDILKFGVSLAFRFV